MFLVSIISAVLAGPACHYVILFGQQNTLCDAEKDFHYSHTFAVWVETDSDNNVTEVFTISWSGEKGVVLLAGPQQGINRDLLRTLERARDRCLVVSMYGPFRTTCATYQRAKCQYQRLERAECTGCPKYTVIDSITRHGHHCPAINCFHVLLDLTGKSIRSGSRNGNEVTEFVIKKYREYGLITSYCPEDLWVWEAVRPEGFNVHYAKCW